MSDTDLCKKVCLNIELIALFGTFIENRPSDVNIHPHLKVMKKNDSKYLDKLSLITSLPSLKFALQSNVYCNTGQHGVPQVLQREEARATTRLLQHPPLGHCHLGH